MRVGADRAHLEAEHRVAVQQPQAQRQAGRPQQAGVGAGALDQLAQLQVAVQRHRLRPAHGHGILHGTVQHHGDEQQHDEVAQQRGHHFVHAQPRLEQRRNQQQQRAGQRGGQHHSGEQHGHGQVEAGAVVQAAHGHGRQRAQVQLALGADVVEARAEGHRAGQAGQHQRRGAGQGLGQREARAEGALEQQRIGAPDGRAGPGHQQRADRQGEEDGRDGASASARRLGSGRRSRSSFMRMFAR